ncbi:MAG: hypothetical protein KGR25_10870, partial [Chloroflexi bacterium]|nr:hypothetical protein [Chloroflexota bacterium]
HRIAARGTDLDISDSPTPYSIQFRLVAMRRDAILTSNDQDEYVAGRTSPERQATVKASRGSRDGMDL